MSCVMEMISKVNQFRVFQKDNSPMSANESNRNALIQESKKKNIEESEFHKILMSKLLEKKEVNICL